MSSGCMCLFLFLQLSFAAAMKHKQIVMEVSVSAHAEGRFPLLGVLYDEIARSCLCQRLSHIVPRFVCALLPGQNGKIVLASWVQLSVWTRPPASCLRKRCGVQGPCTPPCLLVLSQSLLAALWYFTRRCLGGCCGLCLRVSCQGCGLDSRQAQGKGAVQSRAAAEATAECRRQRQRRKGSLF